MWISRDLRKGRRYINSSGISLLSSELKNEYNSSFEISLFYKENKRERDREKFVICSCPSSNKFQNLSRHLPQYIWSLP